LAKIALLGSAPSSYRLAPFMDDEWEIWACSPGNHNAPRVDAWFEIHSLDRKWVAGNEPYIAALQKHPRVYIAAPDPRLPLGIVYPKDDVYKFFGNCQFLDTFMQSQVSYMLAWAIMQKPDTIGLWGIDMAAAEEYGQQRPGCHYFFMEAQKRGIEIVAPPQSDILEPLPPYGYKEFAPQYWRSKARKLELRQAIDEGRQKLAMLQKEIDVKEGAFQNEIYQTNTYLRSPFPPTVTEEPKTEAEVAPDAS
jgi:hypothetical protein